MKVPTVEGMWDILGQEISQSFGRDCASACILMIASLIIRLVIVIIRLEKYTPLGFVFACPLLLQSLGRIFPFMADAVPLLPVRIAESILGRISPARLSVIIPAHFLGCVLGVVVFRAILPIAPSSVISPIFCKGSDWDSGLFLETFSVAAYICLFIILPELLEVNKVSTAVLTPLMMPLIMLARQGSSFSPSAIYALWFADGSTCSLEWEHLVGPLIGALIAGVLCARIIPDDKSSWCKARV